MEITNEKEQRKLDLKSKVKKRKNVLEYRTKPLISPFSKSFEVFAKDDNLIIGNTPVVTSPIIPSSPVLVDLNDEDQPTEMPEIIEISENIPELEDIDNIYYKNKDDNFVLIDNKKDFPSARNRKLLPKSDLTKRETEKISPKSGRELAKTKYSLIEKLENETSSEKNERINRGLQKVMQFVGVMGQVDSYLTDQTRTLIKKLALLCEYDEKEKRRG